ncbi:peptide-methionine (S)-S-oxide reductase MsrA [Geobacter pelophilus]|uniref:Peptide methionine sulfoxide reductase MsrA n=1 Tax=Geoanaerobacter pelophilus TaxID=60036 RepID=A0AAW4L2X7_9BACT|nr:peptide-methionine (S)-S-oxide reductase MsrA [Geoanaerobacter pelophilus]MBT0665084.1 peptide-methionine (S)-S-oxide reductase MsrA [Geoanaerobacter pelophilus]
MKLLLNLFIALLLTFGSGMCSAAQKSESAIFAGGCFWCMESPFDGIDGVISTTVGYTGGFTQNPTYEQVSSGTTGHMEAVQVLYDPGKVSYQQLLDTFWRNIDPLNNGGQFCDNGPQYRAAIFYGNETQKRQAEISRAWLEEERGWQIVTDIRPAVVFYPAEEYHQGYYKKNPLRYRFYRANCGRDERLKELWKGSLSH